MMYWTVRQRVYSGSLLYMRVVAGVPVGDISGTDPPAPLCAIILKRALATCAVCRAFQIAAAVACAAAASSCRRIRSTHSHGPRLAGLSTPYCRLHTETGQRRARPAAVITDMVSLIKCLLKATFPRRFASTAPPPQLDSKWTE